MSAVKAWGQKRTLQVHSKHRCAAGHLLPQSWQHVRVVIPGERHHSGLKRRYAMLEQSFCGPLHVRERIREVLPKGAVDLCIDEPRRDPAVADIERSHWSCSRPGLDGRNATF